jgi:hypothetical protein
MTGFFAQNWGNLASAAGLGVSVWVLTIAQKAKVAAEEAREAARLKSLVGVLEEAYERIVQVGIFVRNQEWDLVRLRGEEVATGCNMVRVRWGGKMSESSNGNLVEASEIARTITRAADAGSVRQLSRAERRQALDSQLALGNLISTVLGEARRTEERRRSK